MKRIAGIYIETVRYVGNQTGAPGYCVNCFIWRRPGLWVVNVQVKKRTAVIAESTARSAIVSDAIHIALGNVAVAPLLRYNRLEHVAELAIAEAYDAMNVYRSRLHQLTIDARAWSACLGENNVIR